MPITLRRVLSLAAYALSVIACGMPAEAQTQVATEVQSSSELEEIVVTARMRDESIQAVPITMNVFTAETIQAAGIAVASAAHSNRGWNGRESGVRMAAGLTLGDF